MTGVNINMRNVIIPMYKKVFNDIMEHKHTTYVFAGGRGSTKSSFVAIMIIIIVMHFKNVHAVCFRKVGNTIQKSIYSQIVWAIYQLGVDSLFRIPKTYASPIIYLPTGQQIFFMGLDDPNKVKSIKVPFGYIGITWFEELDQYSGENELRKVTQSTKRGGDLFWDFRTFNPPISKNNWANEYAEDVEFDSPSTLVIRNTYLDVPPEWLGQEFIDDAEELKRKNERAYTHEYLGLAIGTGGDVFPNAKELDMDKPVTIFDKKVPLWQTFDHIYCGIDWGFAIDPTRFVRMHFDRKRLDLYIFREYNTVKARSSAIFEDLYNNQKLVSKDELIVADSGGGGTFAIADFKAFGAYIRQANKGPDSIEYGIKWLQSLNNIYIDRKHCPETYKEFVNYEYEQDKDGNFISAYPDENNHSIDATRYALEKYWQRKGN